MIRFAPEIYTHKVQESKMFYCKHLGFRVKQELEGFVVLQHTIATAYEIMFCVPNAPFVDTIFHPQYGGQGLIFQITVPDVTFMYAQLQREGVGITLPLKKEPVNGQHFTIVDPNGVLIDIVQFV